MGDLACLPGGGAASSQKSAMATTADEEDAINELLAGLRPPEPEASPPPPPLDERASAALKKQHVDELTDKKVFDTACGGEGTWMLSCTRQDVDFLEERCDGWACCISVVMSLYRADGSLMHDEVGSGRVDKMHVAEEAQQLALERASAGGRKRLAKLFSVALGNHVLGAISKQAWIEATGHEAPPPQHHHSRYRRR